MFTGIVAEIGEIISASPRTLTVAAAKALQGLELGASIDVNGACLTAASFDERSFTVNLLPETLKRTNLGLLSAGDRVNLERAMKLGGELGGHLVQGHVDGTGKIANIINEGETQVIKIEAPLDILHYIVEKGFIAVDGVSLTVTARETSSFQVSVVDYTISNTTLGMRRIGDIVNLEVDIIAKYVERFLKGSKENITVDFLREHGF